MKNHHILIYQVLADFQCNSDSMCQTATGNSATKPFCGTVTSALGANVVSVGVCGQCQIVAGGGGGPSFCTAADAGITGCVQGSCATGYVCCKDGSCKLLQSECPNV